MPFQSQGFWVQTFNSLSFSIVLFLFVCMCTFVCYLCIHAYMSLRRPGESTECPRPPSCGYVEPDSRPLKGREACFSIHWAISSASTLCHFRSREHPFILFTLLINLFKTQCDSALSLWVVLCRSVQHFLVAKITLSCPVPLMCPFSLHSSLQTLHSFILLANVFFPSLFIPFTFSTIL